MIFATIDEIWVEFAWSDWLGCEGHDPKQARFWKAEWSRGFLAAHERLVALDGAWQRSNPAPEPPEHSSWAFQQGWNYYWSAAKNDL